MAENNLVQRKGEDEMNETQKSSERWSNPECPSKFDRECFPPVGLTRLFPHHFRWWRRPFFYRWWHFCYCCCCDHKTAPMPEPKNSCAIDLQLEPNTFGPGKSIHILVVAVPFQYFAEFYLMWTANSSGQVTVDLELISGPVSTPQLLADDRGPSDRYLFSTNQPGSYLFRATATDAQGDACFDTLQVDLPSV
jgi:hypothetical protein